MSKSVKQATKPVPPVLRERRRYIAFRMLSKVNFTENQVNHAIWFPLMTVFGEDGAARSNFYVVEYNQDTRYGIVRTTAEELNNTMVALTLLSDIQGKRAACHVLGVSGTIDALKEKFFKGIEVKKEAAPAEEEDTGASGSDDYDSAPAPKGKDDYD